MSNVAFLPDTPNCAILWAPVAHPEVPIDTRAGFLGTIGNTPLIRLARLSDETGCEILAKAEFLNPGGSVKDRAALWIIRDAEARGTLKPGGTVVEGTAGNTGIGLAHICAARGYRCVIVIPETQSPEKFEMLRVLGAEVRPVPAVPYRDPGNYQKVAGRLATELEHTRVEIQPDSRNGYSRVTLMGEASLPHVPDANLRLPTMDG